MRRLEFQFTSIALLSLTAAGCSDGGGPSTQTQLDFNLATRTSVQPAASPASLVTIGTPETFTDGSNTLVITKVELVLREIELRRAGVTADCADGAGDDCRKLELGPVLLDLPLGTGGASRDFSVQLTPGSYDKVEFEIHAPSGSDDAGFVQAHPDLQDVSVRVSGTYNGAEFSYTGKFSAKMEFDLDPPLTAGETGVSDLTLFVDLNTWFRGADGLLLDPATANPGQPQESRVEQNVKGSLEAFEDHDHDGRDDHGGADDGPSHQ